MYLTLNIKGNGLHEFLFANIPEDCSKPNLDLSLKNVTYDRYWDDNLPFVYFTTNEMGLFGFNYLKIDENLNTDNFQLNMEKLPYQDDISLNDSFTINLDNFVVMGEKVLNTADRKIPNLEQELIEIDNCPLCYGKHKQIISNREQLKNIHSNLHKPIFSFKYSLLKNSEDCVYSKIDDETGSSISYSYNDGIDIYLSNESFLPTLNIEE